MNTLIRTLVLSLSLTFAGCSTQIKGPVTGKQYKVDVGCTEDMQRYREEREAVVGKTAEKIKAKDIKLECPPDQPIPDESEGK